MAEEFKRLDRKLVYHGTIIDYYRDTIQVPNGNIAEWDFIGHKGAAAVVPVREDGKLLMVRQWRNALDRYTLEIPAGGLNCADEPPMLAAARELEEETGYHEFIDVYAYSVDELCEMIYYGKIEDGKTIAAIMSYKAKYEK